MLRVEVAGACFDGLPVSNETDKSEYLGARNCKADPNKAAAACQIEFSGGTTANRGLICSRLPIKSAVDYLTIWWILLSP
jgi:hypothetical protein